MEHYYGGCLGCYIWGTLILGIFFEAEVPSYYGVICIDYTTGV